MEIFAASQLFLRMADLDWVRRVRTRFAVGLVGFAFAGTDPLFPAGDDGNSRHGSAGAAQPGKRISSLPANDERVCAVVSEKGAGIMTAARREAAPGLQARAASHAQWLPAAQAQLAERFWYESLVESGVLPDFDQRLIPEAL